MQDHRTIVVADHHKSVFVCQVVDRQTGEASKRTLASSRSVLEPFLKELQGPVLVYVEACRGWEWVSDLCSDLGIDFKLVDPSRMPEISRSSKKTDEHDVQAMVNRLLVSGELPESYRATRSERELRGLTRRLTGLRRDKQRLMNRIHAVVDSHGMPARKSSFTKEEWREDVKRILSADAWLLLESLLSQLDIATAWTELIEIRVGDLVKERPDYSRLQRIPGIGPVLGATILAESAGIRRFGTGRKYCAFAGIVPRVRSSAGVAKIGHITHEGPSDLRWALGQAAIVGLCARESTAISRMYRRKKKKGKPGKVAICAAAHKLARIVYVLLTRDEPFQPSPMRKSA